MRLKEYFVGRKILQTIFDRLFKISLRGMNYGLGGMLSSSGETNLVKIVRNQLDQLRISNKILLDIGANDGKYTDILLDTFSQNDKIYCFEPSQFSFKELSKKHGAKSNVELVALGLGSTTESRRLFYDEKGSGWASVFERKGSAFSHALTQSEEINIVTLDDYCAKNNISRINFLKADVEGFELEVFKGSKRMLPNIDFIQFEFSFANLNSKTYLLDFFEILSDFRIHRVLKDGIEEIEKYDPRYEILMTTNYLAVNRKISIR